jgi:hypothetical protein
MNSKEVVPTFLDRWAIGSTLPKLLEEVGQWINLGTQSPHKSWTEDSPHLGFYVSSLQNSSKI